VITSSIQEFLGRSNVPYAVFPHPPAYTAQEEASVTHTSGQRWAKSVACFADGIPVLAVVPAHCLVDLERLADIVDATSVRLATEDELQWLFMDCEPGAMPPLGPLYHQRVFLDSSLALGTTMSFNGGTHKDAIRMRVEDFIDLTAPVMGRFAVPA
jgi:Ala-tRNA(Pro) deacylase